MKHSGFNTFQITDNLFPVFSIVDSSCSIRQESLSGFSRYDTFADTVEKQNIQFFLQLLDLLGKCTLGDMQYACSFREILPFTRFFEVLQLSQFHALIVFIYKTYRKKEFCKYIQIIFIPLSLYKTKTNKMKKIIGSDWGYSITILSMMRSLKVDKRNTLYIELL